MTSPLWKLRESLDSLSPTEQAAARQILEQPELVESLSIHGLAKQTYVSPSTVVRLCHHAGYGGYREFRKAVSAELLLRRQNASADAEALSPADTLERIVEKVTYRNRLSLEDTRALMDIEQLRQCLELIRDARCLHLYAEGSGLGAAKAAQLRFLGLGKSVLLSEDPGAQLLQAQAAEPGDRAIVLSCTGQEAGLLSCIQALRARAVPVIVIAPVGSTLASEAEHRLCIPGENTAQMAQLNIVDILCAALANPPAMEKG